MATRVLLIDDDARLHALLAEYLAPHGVEVGHAPDGGRGLAALESGAWDAVLLDVMMPGMDGLEVCRRIRARKTLEGVRLLTMTAHLTPRLEQESREAGAETCLQKPVDVEQVLEIFRVPLALSSAARR